MRLPAWLLALAVSLGAVLALADGTPNGPTTVGASPSASTSASASAVAPVATSWVPVGGTAPIPGGGVVPKTVLPPGADFPDPGPSRAVYPVQKLPLRFFHDKHVEKEKLACKTCHPLADKSTSAGDDLLPKKHDLCIDCHSIDEKNPQKADSPPARCDACHLGVTITGGVASVPKVVLPKPNLKMNHQAHAKKGIACAECHGEVGKLELATRDQLPRMKGCFGCHQSSDAGGPKANKSAGAKSACSTCHLTRKDGVLETLFVSGVLLPPKWLKNAQHGSDWLVRHKKVAGADSGFCGSCHREQECVDCHDGKTKPKLVHPNDWLSTHAIAARFDDPKCSSCHSQTNFCLPCHTRVGVAPSSPSGIASSIRFHPPAVTWQGPKKGPGHHALEAQKNIMACVSCHVERDCVVCHGTTGVGGKGAGNPHGSSFTSGCAVQFGKNPRPCFVCHLPSDKNLTQCK